MRELGAKSVVVMMLIALLASCGSSTTTAPASPTAATIPPTTTAVPLTAEGLIAECAGAMGGIEKVAALQTMRFAQYLPDHGGLSRYEIKRPNRVRLGDTVVFDGERAAWLTEGEPIPQEEWKDFEVDIAWYVPAFFDYPAEYLGTEVVDGIETHKLQVTLPLGAVMTYFLDAQTHLVHKAAAYLTVAGQEYHPERTYSDYRSVDGILYPHAFSYEGRNGSDVFTATIRDIEFNIPLGDERFSAPPTPTAMRVKGLIEWADLRTGKGPVYSQAWSPDGRLLVTADTEQVRVWDMTTRREAGVLRGHTSFVWGLAWSPDGGVLASASQDGTVRLWDVSAHTTTAVLETGWAYCLDWSPDGRQLAVGNDAGDVQRWDVAAQEVLETWSSEANDARDDVISVAWSPDGQTVAFGDLAGGIYLWDVATSRARLVLMEQNPSDRGHDVNGLAWSPDGRTLASTHPDGQVQLWDGATGQLVRAIAAHTGWARGVAWSPDGRFLASTGQDKRICLWDAQTGQEYAEQHHNFLPVWSVSWSPDGTKVASGAGDYEQEHVGATIVWRVP